MNSNFYSLWFDPTGNRTQVYRFSSRCSIHSTTERLLKRFISCIIHMAEVKSKTPGSSMAEVKPSKDRFSRGQGQDCSRPRTQRGSVLPKKGLRSKCSQVFRKFQAISKEQKKKVFAHKFTNFPQNSCINFFTSSLACSKTKQHCSRH